MTSTEIENFKEDLRNYVDEIEFTDDILQRLYHQKCEQVCNDLSTLWFYHDALKQRGKKNDKL